ncbi:MAG: CDP-alcohol phosphatidyltransferase family protein [Gemmatimonadales bacterium]|nr:MAG: CDP-alcohol phosphatidyltransferase family protein [Gemmatimonadales bacterium]
MASLKDLRGPVYRIIEPVTRALVRWGVHPNALTSFGFLVTVFAGLLYHMDHVRWAGFFVLLGGLVDIFDGRVARESGLASKFGSFYDSTLDRMSEIVVFIGLISLYNQYGRELADAWMIYVIALAMGGSVMVSYTRARAEALGLDCSVGFMQRAERVALLGGGSLFFGLMWDGLVLKVVLVILAITTVLTAIQRIVWVYLNAAGVPLDEAQAPPSNIERTESISERSTRD